jgi:hypothetical protein
MPRIGHSTVLSNDVMLPNLGGGRSSNPVPCLCRTYDRSGQPWLLPVAPDPLTVMAVVLRKPFPVFLMIVAVARFGRYLVFAAIAMNWV